MVKVDKELCIGCGLCQSMCPEVFEIGDDAKARVINQIKSPCIKEAIESCPVEAIS